MFTDEVDLRALWGLCVWLRELYRTVYPDVPGAEGPVLWLP